MINIIDYSDSMVDCVQYVESFYVYENGNKKTLDKTSKEFALTLKNVENVFKTARVMPAFGVSLHEETLKEIRNDNWLQINFSKQMNKNDLLFNSLIFKLEKTNGINLIRLYNGKYEGRCIFLDFDDEVDLNELINKLANNK